MPRLITGRDLYTGESKHFILQNSKGEHLKPYSPIGILNYLIILEMLGNFFESDKESMHKRGITSALHHFSNLNEKERFTLDAFRNGLAHSYSLVNIPREPKNNENSRHIFAFTAFLEIPLIKYPVKNWNGEYINADENQWTWIQVNKLFDLIETIIKQISEGIEKNEIKLKIPLIELKSRYTIHS